MTDQHATDVIALVKELAEVEFRRGTLHALVEWHLQLHQVATTQAASTPVGPVAELELVPPEKRPRQKRRVLKVPARGLQERIFASGGLRAAILAHLAEHPHRTPRQVAHAINGHYESTRQALIRMAQAGILKRTMGGSYVLVESHPGSGLAKVDAGAAS